MNKAFNLRHCGKVNKKTSWRRSNCVRVCVCERC